VSPFAPGQLGAAGFLAEDRFADVAGQPRVARVGQLLVRDINNLAGMLRALGDLDGAKTHFERALRIFEATYGLDHPHTRSVAADLAGVQGDQ
jgi:hypothetical protein